MIQFPNNRLTYTGKQGPVYDNDGQNAINGLFSAINMLLGLSPTGFAILSGFVYSSGSYGSGYFYLNGVIYYFAGGITSGQCLVPNITQINNAQFSDGVSRNTYQIFGSTTSSTASGSTSPLFTSNMDSYRLNLTVLNNLISALQSSVSGLTSSKADKVSGATNNNFAALNGSGDLIDSGDNAASFDAAGAASTAQSAAIAAAEAYTDGKFGSGVGAFTPDSNYNSGTITCNYLLVNGRYIVTITFENILTHTADENGSEQTLGQLPPSLAPTVEVMMKAVYVTHISDNTNYQNYFRIFNSGGTCLIKVMQTRSTSIGIYGTITYIV